MTTVPDTPEGQPQQNIQSNSNSNNNNNSVNNSNSSNCNNNKRDNDNSAEAIKFIHEHLQLSFDENNTRTLFNFYCLNYDTTNTNSLRLEAFDIRKLLFDILSAQNWPLVVPDSSLDAVLRELCLNEKGSISWIEFKSFFVFLQDRPLLKLFQLTTKQFTKQKLQFARLITINPVGQPIEASQISYDRKPWNQAISDLLPEATGIFIYFLSGGSLLALVIGNFDTILENMCQAEICMNSIQNYTAEMQMFDSLNNHFPPIARSAGLKSKVARKLADSYVTANKWDANNFQLVQKSSNLMKKANSKWTEIDDKYKVKQKVNTTTENWMASIKQFDDKHQISTRVSQTARDIDTKYKISETATTTMDKIKQNETFQAVSTKINDTYVSTVQTVTEISTETLQLVNEQTQEQKQAQEQPPLQQQQQAPQINPQNNAGNNINSNSNSNVEQQQQPQEAQPQQKVLIGQQ